MWGACQAHRCRNSENRRRNYQKNKKKQPQEVIGLFWLLIKALLRCTDYDVGPGVQRCLGARYYRHCCFHWPSTLSLETWHTIVNCTYSTNMYVLCTTTYKTSLTFPLNLSTGPHTQTHKMSFPTKDWTLAFLDVFNTFYSLPPYTQRCRLWLLRKEMK